MLSYPYVGTYWTLARCHVVDILDEDDGKYNSSEESKRENFVRTVPCWRLFLFRRKSGSKGLPSAHNDDLV